MGGSNSRSCSSMPLRPSKDDSTPSASSVEPLREAFLRRLQQCPEHQEALPDLSAEKQDADCTVDDAGGINITETKPAVASPKQSAKNTSEPMACCAVTNPDDLLMNKRSKVTETEQDAAAADPPVFNKTSDPKCNSAPQQQQCSATVDKNTSSFNNDNMAILVEGIFGCTVSDTGTSLQQSVWRDPKFYATGLTLFLPSLLKELTLDGTVSSQNADASVSKTPKKKTLTLDHIEHILTHGVRFFMESNAPFFLWWMSDCFSRCNIDVIKEDATLLRAWKLLKNVEKIDFETARKTIVRYAALAIQCPDYFLEETESSCAADDTAAVSVTEAVVTVLQRPQSVDVDFLTGVWDEILENSEADFVAIIVQVLDRLNAILTGRHMNDLRSEALSGLMILATSHKAIAVIIAARSYFLCDSGGKDSAFKSETGWELQSSSLLGHILRPTSLDEPMVFPDVSKSTRLSCFTSLFSKPSSVINRKIDNIREEIHGAVKSGLSLTRLLCKNGARTECLKWLSKVIDANEKRRQQAIVQQLNHFASMSTTLELFAIRSHGFSCVGFNLNVFWLLLKLLEPVKMSKVPDLDAGYLLREDSVPLLGSFLQESRLGSAEEIERLTAAYKETPEGAASPKFPTEILFLALRALRCLFCPAIKEYQACRQMVIEKQETINQNGTSQDNRSGYEDAVAQILCFNAALLSPSFLKSFWHLTRLVITWLGWMMLTNGDQASDTADGSSESASIRSALEDSSRFASFLHKATRSRSVATNSSSLFLALPYCILDDLMECVQFFLMFPAETPSHSLVTTSVADSLHHVNEDLLAAFLLFIVRSDTIVRNPHCRWSSGYESFFYLHNNSIFATRIDNMEGVIRWLIPSLIKCFIEAQKAGYYARVDQRLVCTRHFEMILESERYSERLKQFANASGNQKVFVRFLAMLVESMSWLLEEGMAVLIEIKEKESGHTSSVTGSRQPGEQAAEPSVHNHLPLRGDSEPALDDDSDDFDIRQVEGGHNVSEMPLSQLEGVCRTLMDGGCRAVKVMALIAEICGSMIVNSSLVLARVVTSLNCCLEHLVGPRCLQLKVSNFEKYNFDPRFLLATTCKIYITLAKSDTEDCKQLVSAVCNDTRYFRFPVFSKAFFLIKREGLVDPTDLTSFGELLLLLKEKSTLFQVEEQWLADIWEQVPDEFKDPIMDDLMEDPVKLPTSGHIMDRKNIERHLMTEEFDPFNRMALKASDLIPQQELRQRIVDFVAMKKKERECSSTCEDREKPEAV